MPETTIVMEDGLDDFLNCVAEVLPQHPYFQRPQRQAIVLPKCRQTIDLFLSDPQQLNIRQLQFIQMILRRRFDLNQILPSDWHRQSWLKSRASVRHAIAKQHLAQRRARRAEFEAHEHRMV